MHLSILSAKKISDLLVVLPYTLQARLKTKIYKNIDSLKEDWSQFQPDMLLFTAEEFNFKDIHKNIPLDSIDFIQILSANFSPSNTTKKQFLLVTVNNHTNHEKLKIFINHPKKNTIRLKKLNKYLMVKIE